MGRITFVLAALLLGGCAVVATVAAVPAALIEGTVNFIRGQKESLPINMQTSLASVQQGLRRMDLTVDVLEPANDGYGILFGNEKLDGKIELSQKTSMLTTISITVRQGLSRQHSVEQAIIKVIRDISEQKNARKTFDFHIYHHVRILPSIKAQRIGWYRPGALLKASQSRKKDWIRIKMPSGKWGYVKGKLPVKLGLGG